MNQSNLLLIEQAQAGNEQALSQLLVVCQPDLKRFARKTCSTSTDAEDAVQIALWQLHRKIGMLKTVAAFTSWIFRIIERECYRLFKKQPDFDEFSESSLNIASPSKEDNLRIDLTRSITSLPPIYRTVFILRDIEELTAPETAAQLGISVEAVKSRLHRARALIRENLSQGGYL